MAVATDVLALWARTVTLRSERARRPRAARDTLVTEPALASRVTILEIPDSETYQPAQIVARDQEPSGEAVQHALINGT